MKVKKDYIPREVAGEYIAIPVGEAVNSTRGLIGLSESGYLLFQRLQQECSEDELVQLLKAEYDADEAIIRQDVTAFLKKMRTLNMLAED